MAAVEKILAPAAHELVMTRLFDAPIALVFKLWTDPVHAMRWWGPKEFPITRLDMDARTGGTWRACLTSPETGEELWQGGVMKEIVEPTLLVFTFAWEAEGERGIETLITIRFSDENGKTRMHFHQAPFQSEGERDGHRYGWNSCFDRLDAYLADMS